MPRKKELNDMTRKSIPMSSEMIDRIESARKNVEGGFLSFSECVRRAVDIVYPNGQYDIFGDPVQND